MQNSSTGKKGMFVTADGQNVAFTFILVSSLFLLWGFCNGMIDVMDKHFQEELHLTLSQSAWVQFAHYLGYFLMSLPAGWLAIKLGYKGGIISGLLMVAAGGFWFLEATKISAFWAFLLGVCVIASGLTFLETVANPYTTVLGDQRFAATRINLAQSCNGIGWIFGPIAGRKFFYATNAAGQSTGGQTLWIPYVAVAVVVVILAVVFRFANVPDIKMEDDYRLDEPDAANSNAPAAPVGNRCAAMFALWLNIVVLAAAIGMIVSAIASIFVTDGGKILTMSLEAGAVVALIGSVILFARAKSISRHSIWVHPHFSSATLAQFFYVAAQSGIFAYFINYMTSQAPMKISNADASSLASLGFICFLSGRFIGAGLLRKFPAHKVLGIFGLGVRAKKAAGYIVMAIMGGAIMPKLMGHIADKTDISHGFIVPMGCFAIVALYAFLWPKLANSEGMHGVDPARAH